MPKTNKQSLIKYFFPHRFRSLPVYVQAVPRPQHTQTHRHHIQGSPNHGKSENRKQLRKLTEMWITGSAEEWELVVKQFARTNYVTESLMLKSRCQFLLSVVIRPRSYLFYICHNEPWHLSLRWGELWPLWRMEKRGTIGHDNWLLGHEIAKGDRSLARKKCLQTPRFLISYHCNSQFRICFVFLYLHNAHAFRTQAKYE